MQSCFRASTADVQAIVRICAAHGLPVIPFGAGTSLEGQVNAPLGGVSHRLSRHEPLLAVHAEDLDCVVEPGVTRKQLNDAAARPGPVLPDRSRRRRHARRHGGDPRLRHQCGALRHHEGQCAGAQGGAGRRRGDHDRRGGPASRPPATTSPGCSSAPKARSASSPRSPCGCTASPNRSPPASARFPRSRRACDAAIATIQIGHPGRPHRVARRAAGPRPSTPIRSSACRSRRRCSSNSTAARPRSPSSPRSSARSPRDHRRRPVRMGDPARGPLPAVAGPP